MNKFKKLLVGVVAIMTFWSIVPMEAHAEWKSDNQGWWYTEGASWSTGWKYIDGNWYYFNADGYMAHDITIDGCYLNSSGAWVTKETTRTNNYTSTSSNKYVDSSGNGLIKGSKNNIYHVPGSKYYDKTTNIAQWFKSVEEAEAAGYRAPEK